MKFTYFEVDTDTNAMAIKIAEVDKIPACCRCKQVRGMFRLPNRQFVCESCGTDEERGLLLEE